ncbi:MAG: DUF5915 domain-containing protein, partial [Bacteroidota bacterium]
LRKNNGFEVTDRIHIKISTAAWDEAVTAYSDYICKETLGEDLQLETFAEGEEIDINGTTGYLALNRV